MMAQRQAHQAKKAAHPQAGERSGVTLMPQPPRKAPTPVITEADLLAFQYAHFGDDSKPDHWFVDAETALNLQSAYTVAEDSELGCYPDGAKRTLTDEQIEIFRHSEIQELLRERRRQREEQELDEREPEQDRVAETRQPPLASDASSLEAEHVGLATPAVKQTLHPSPKRQPSQSSRSESSRSTSRRAAKKTKRAKDVPYDERHKRKWEDFIEDNDPVQGSLTFRRVVRQLDDKQDEPVVMDY